MIRTLTSPFGLPPLSNSGGIVARSRRAKNDVEAWYPDGNEQRRVAQGIPKVNAEIAEKGHFLDIFQQVSQFFPLRLQILYVALSRFHFDGDPFDDIDTVPFETDELLGVIGHQPHMLYPKVD